MIVSILYDRLLSCIFWFSYIMIVSILYDRLLSCIFCSCINSFRTYFSINFTPKCLFLRLLRLLVLGCLCLHHHDPLLISHPLLLLCGHSFCIAYLLLSVGKLRIHLHPRRISSKSSATGHGSSRIHHLHVGFIKNLIIEPLNNTTSAVYHT